MKVISMIIICLVLLACTQTKKTTESAETKKVTPIEIVAEEEVTPIEIVAEEEATSVEIVAEEEATPIEIVAEEEITQIEKEVLVWQNIPKISNSNFYKAVTQKLYQKYGVDCTNALVVVPSLDATAGVITIPLNKKYDSFFTRVCVVVDNPWPYETITIYCDGQERESIKKIGSKNAPHDLNINTENVDVLTIKVKPGRKSYYERVVFFDTILKINN